MSERKPRRRVISEIELRILMGSARRCALCYGLEGDLRQKKGQIVHIDHDPSHGAEENLVFLCLVHHDEYDSKTSQAKGITTAEIRKYRERLERAILHGEHRQSERTSTSAEIRDEAIRGHDERLFKESDAIMPEKLLRDFLQQLRSDHSFYTDRMRQADKFRVFFAESGNQFIDEIISQALRTLLEKIDSLLLFLATDFFVYPKDQRRAEILRLCMRPSWNVDRDGEGDPEQDRKYDLAADKLEKFAGEVIDSYREYRSGVKRVLFL